MIRIFRYNIEWEIRILLSIIIKLPDYYYIFDYYISGRDQPTENVITENVIHPTKPVYRKRLDKTDGMGVS